MILMILVLRGWWGGETLSSVWHGDAWVAFSHLQQRLSQRPQPGFVSSQKHMKMKWVALFFAWVGMMAVALLQAQAAVLKVDSSADMDQWQEIPAGLITAGAGGIEVADDGGPREFFRLRLESAAGGSVVPVAEVDSVRVGVAQDFLGSFASDTNSIDPEEGGNGAPAEAAWIGASDLEIDDYARPIYDPAVDAGLTPAYYEF